MLYPRYHQKIIFSIFHEKRLLSVSCNIHIHKVLYSLIISYFNPRTHEGCDVKARYNHCSWLGEILRNQTFPLLTIPSLDVNDLVAGTNNALEYNPDCSHAPAFIAPPSYPATFLQNQITSLIQEVYRMANLSLVINTSQNNNSGIARQLEFE